MHQRCKIVYCDWKSIPVSIHCSYWLWSIYKPISVFFLKCLIIQIQKTIFYFQIKNQNYQIRNIKHTTLITPYFNLYLFTCLSVSCTTQHKATLHVHPYLNSPVLCGFWTVQIMWPVWCITKLQCSHWL